MSILNPKLNFSKSNPSFFFKREIHPVGQGAFYTENFIVNGTLFSAVYDCGSSSSRFANNKKPKSEFDNFIKSAFSSKNLDVLFISHFHEDHTNGISFLPEPKVTVLPLLSDKQKIVLKLGYVLSHSRIPPFLENPKNILNNSHFIQVLPNSYDLSDNFTDLDGKPINPEDYVSVSPVIDISDLDNSIQNLPSVINSNIPIIIKTHKLQDIAFWEFLPFNYIDNAKINLVIDAIKNDSRLSWDTIKLNPRSNYVYKNREIIADAFKSVNINPNEFSMMVYSGPLEDGLQLIDFKTIDGQYVADCTFDWKAKFPIPYPITPKCLISELACLYTGDIKIDLGWLVPYLKGLGINRINLISGVQIPHHGSKNNNGHLLVKELNNFRLHRERVFFISADPSYKYHHPDTQEIEAILSNKHNDDCLYLVSTLSTSSLVLE